MVPLQQHFINETANPNVTKIRGAPCKKRIKNVMELSKNRGVIQEESSNIHNNNQVRRVQDYNVDVYCAENLVITRKNARTPTNNGNIICDKYNWLQCAERFFFN